MIILAAMLASGQLLPSIDRAWLTERARLESVTSANLSPLKLKPTPPSNNFRKLMSYENTTGM